MRVRRLGCFLTVLLLAFGAQVASAAPSGYDLFQKALVKERAEGNIDEAIQLYQRIVKDFAADRTVAAKALVQIGQCYEKLGKEEARKAYQRVLREFENRNRRATPSHPEARQEAIVAKWIDAKSFI